MKVMVLADVEHDGIHDNKNCEIPINSNTVKFALAYRFILLHKGGFYTNAYNKGNFNKI